MGFRKTRSVQVSERVFDLVCDHLDNDATEDYVRISGYLSTFNNCREQGFVLSVSSVDWDNPNKTGEDIHVWACEARSSDEIMVIWQNNYPNNGMFSDDAYNNNKKYFHYNELEKAADFIIDLVKEHFKSEYYKEARRG